jgi:aspartyl/asparaginyl beta-hydroxylase (cupin superfamily)
MPPVEASPPSDEALEFDILRRAMMALHPKLEAEHGRAAMERVSGLFQFYAQGVRPQEASGNPLQQPRCYFMPGLRNKPFWDGNETPAFAETLKLFEDHWELIRDEALASRKHFSRNEEPTLKAMGAEGNPWTSLGMSHSGTEFFPNARKAVPRTIEIIERNSRRGDQHFFSAVAPNTHIPAHCGPMNTRVRMHLALKVTPDCEIRVGSERRTWKEGRVLSFDDSFEHEVWNGPAGTRIVLITDVWHPDLTQVEVVALRRVDEELTAALGRAQADIEARKVSPWKRTLRRLMGSFQSR